MRATLTRAALIAGAALLLMGSCFAWDNHDPDRANWILPSPAAWFFVAMAVVLLIVVTRKKS